MVTTSEGAAIGADSTELEVIISSREERVIRTSFPIDCVTEVSPSESRITTSSTSVTALEFNNSSVRGASSAGEGVSIVQVQKKEYQQVVDFSR